nr:hypothetical protein 2 - wheat dwarf virus [Wheat dwarf virus]
MVTNKKPSAMSSSMIPGHLFQARD